jgi:hypothetical protein
MSIQYGKSRESTGAKVSSCAAASTVQDKLLAVCLHRLRPVHGGSERRWQDIIALPRHTLLELNRGIIVLL